MRLAPGTIISFPMLIPPEPVMDEVARIYAKLESGEIDHTTAGQRILKLDPEASDGYFLLSAAAERQDPPDLERAESLLWEAANRSPCEAGSYFSLAELLAAHRPDDPMLKAVTLLGLWKVAISGKVPSGYAELLRGQHSDLDWSDPKTFEILASAWEEEIEDAGEPSEVAQRLLPYRLLNRVQLEAEMMTGELVSEILDHGAACEPVFRGVLSNWGRDDQAVDAVTLRLATALLAEISGTELIPSLLVLATHEDLTLMLHAQWAIARLAQRFPEQAKAALHAAVPAAGVNLRCVLAEQIGLLPDYPEREAALLGLLQDFGAIAAEPDAPYLLLTVCFFLNEAGKSLLARETALRFERTLPKDSRGWIREIRETEGGFTPVLFGREVHQLTIEQVAVEGVLAEDSDSDDDEPWDGEEDDGPREAMIVPPKPGRNDPCWCGSGRKYKKCHLDEDQVKERSGGELPV
jgi:hypothetical protein